MKALIIGGTGTISKRVVQLAIQTGWDVTLLNRGSHLLPEGARGLRADMHDEAAVAALLKNERYDVVADFIAFTPEDVRRDLRLFSGRCGQYIFISTASAYQKPPVNFPIDEGTPLANPFWEYSRLKIACEDLLAAHTRETGQPVTIVRPSHTYDKRSIPLAVKGNKGGWQVLRRILDQKPVPVHGDGTSLWTFTHSRDFARGFVGLMGNPHAYGQAVQVTGDEAITWNAAYRALGNALGVQPNIVHVPSEVLAAADEGWGYHFGGGLLGDKANCAVFDNRKLKALVPGFTAQIRFDEGIRECVRHYQSTVALQVEDPQFDRFCDLVAGAMQAARSALGKGPAACP